MGLVHSVGPVHHSTPPSREDQHPSRPRIQGVPGQQRLDDKPNNCQTVSDELSNRSLCLPPHTSIDRLHQLETRPGGSTLRCLHSELEGSCGICLPTLQLSSNGPEQSSVRPDRDRFDSSGLASPALVAPVTPTSGTTTGPATQQQRSVAGPIRPLSDPSNVPTSTPGRISHLQQCYQAEGLPSHVTNLLIPAARSSTRKTYESSWQRWSHWCSTRQINPISTTLNNVLTFLADSFDSGLQYRTINVLRSALSSTHPQIDGYPVGQHPYIINLMKGILNNRPPKPRYSYTWDVRAVTGYIKQMGDNSALKLKQLSLKLALLFAITCPKRVSSLANLDLNHHRFSPEGLTFTLFTTKTTRPDETVTAFYTVFPGDKRLCPVACFKEYISVTAKFRNSTKDQFNRLFLSFIKPHKPVTSSTLACWIRSLLGDSGIDTEIFKAHSVRGAATSAAANMEPYL